MADSDEFVKGLKSVLPYSLAGIGFYIILWAVPVEAIRFLTYGHLP